MHYSIYVDSNMSLRLNQEPWSAEAATESATPPMQWLFPKKKSTMLCSCRPSMSYRSIVQSWSWSVPGEHAACCEGSEINTTT